MDRRSFIKKLAVVPVITCVGVPVLEEENKFLSIEMSWEDKQFIESMHFTAVEIARFYKVPPALLGNYSASVFKSASEE